MLLERGTVDGMGRSRFYTRRLPAEEIARVPAKACRHWGSEPSSTPGPPPCDLVLLADARLVREPDLYPVCSDALLPRDLVQARREAFLISSTAPSA